MGNFSLNKNNLLLSTGEQEEKKKGGRGYPLLPLRPQTRRIENVLHDQ